MKRITIKSMSIYDINLSEVVEVVMDTRKNKYMNEDTVFVFLTRDPNYVINAQVSQYGIMQYLAYINTKYNTLRELFFNMHNSISEDNYFNFDKTNDEKTLEGECLDYHNDDIVVFYPDFRSEFLRNFTSMGISVHGLSSNFGKKTLRKISKMV